MTYSHTHINIQIMATEVYGNFLDVFDEFANPVDISVESEVTYEQKTNFQPKGLFGDLLAAIEKANLTQAASTESIRSLLSNASLASSDSTSQLGPVGSMFHAIQSLTLPSSNSLSTLPTSSSKSEIDIKTIVLLPPFVVAMFTVIEKFMQNHPVDSADDSFPKFC